jgi:hypothetical protein
MYNTLVMKIYQKNKGHIRSERKINCFTKVLPKLKLAFRAVGHFISTTLI